MPAFPHAHRPTQQYRTWISANQREKGPQFDLVIAVRNYLSHRSSGSVAILRKRLTELNAAGAASPLNGTVNSVAVYLNTRPVSAAHCRAKLVGHTVIALAAKLV